MKVTIDGTISLKGLRELIHYYVSYQVFDPGNLTIFLTHPNYQTIMNDKEVIRYSPFLYTDSGFFFRVDGVLIMPYVRMKDA